jgi:hypothetical protein
MTPHHGVRRLAVAFVLGALPLAAAMTPANAAAAGPAAQGWWSEAPALAVNPLADGNLHVGNDPTGPNAIAAVRYAVPGSVDGKPVDAATVAGVLTLSAVAGSTLGTPALVACPVRGAWESAMAGEWSKRPTFSCTASAAGTPTSDGTAVRFSLTPALQARPGVYDLAIVPAPASTSPFAVAFEKAAPGSLALTGGRAIAPAVAAPEPASSSASPTADAPTAAATADPLPAAPLPATLPSPAEPIVSTSAAPAETDNRAVTSTARARKSVAASAATNRHGTHRGQRAIAFVTLAMLGAGLWWFGGMPSRPARGIGPLAGKDVAPATNFRAAGGVGRFTRPRHHPPGQRPSS